MKKLHSFAYLFALILTVPGLAAEAEELHPLMTSKYWGNLGVYFSALHSGIRLAILAKVGARPPAL
jgi:hypothetical protein